jgi:hypothetical protein
MYHSSRAALTAGFQKPRTRPRAAEHLLVRRWCREVHMVMRSSMNWQMTQVTYMVTMATPQPGVSVNLV